MITARKQSRRKVIDGLVRSSNDNCKKTMINRIEERAEYSRTEAEPSV